MVRRWMIVCTTTIALAVGSCGGGSGGKPCSGGTDPAGRACTKNLDCSVGCVCENSSGKHFRITADLCRANNTCASAAVMCSEACLIALGAWTGNFCTKN
jgi:hypothetical protein